MNEDLITNLKKLAEEHEKHLYEIKQKITDLDYIPKAKALIGKCFKYPGGSGFYAFGVSMRLKGKTSYVYKRIIGADKEYVIVDSFHVESPAKIDITFHEKEYVSHFTNKGMIQVTEKQYFKAFNKMVKYVFETGKKEN